MKQFLLRLAMASALTLCLTLWGASASGQQPSSQEPAARPQQEPNEPPASTGQNEPQKPAAGTDVQTQDAKAFTGRIVKENGKIVLKDPVTKTSYQIDDISKVKSYVGKEVKVTGKLDMNSNTIHVESIEPLS